MRFFTDTDLGPRQSLLPSGTLWCRDVVIARCGEQDYHSSEIGADGNGMVIVTRDPEQVFDPTAMASFEGAPVTMGHPSDEVGPSNWRSLSVGHIQNVRRSGDLLVADMLIHDQRAIDAIRSGGWRGVSLGYTAEYTADGPGRAKQVNIRGNHAAVLAPYDEPRCGDACMIGDAAPRPAMTLDRAVHLLKTRDCSMHEHAAAAAFVSSYYTTEGRHLLRPLGSKMTIKPLNVTDAELRAGVRRWFKDRGPNIATADGRMSLMREREQRQQGAMRSIAQANRDFWSKHSHAGK